VQFLLVATRDESVTSVVSGSAPAYEIDAPTSCLSANFIFAARLTSDVGATHMRDLRLLFVAASANSISARSGRAPFTEQFEPDDGRLGFDLGVETGLAPKAMLPYRRRR